MKYQRYFLLSSKFNQTKNEFFQIKFNVYPKEKQWIMERLDTFMKISDAVQILIIESIDYSKKSLNLTN